MDGGIGDPETVMHPDQNDLLRYANGSLPNDRIHAISQHVVSCQRCKSIIETLVSPGHLRTASTVKEADEWDKDTVVPDTVTPTHSSPPAIADSRDFGDYELIEEIARGGMGVVFKARQKNVNRIVALKMILSGTLAGQEHIDRFYAEAEAAASLDHPNIVPVFEVGKHQSQHFFSMALVEGQSLAQKTREEPMTPRDAALLMMELAHAVQYAHERGIVHRDLKPANILLDTNGTPRITDFGLAKRIEGDSGMTSTGQIMGTPSYMAPEQARGDTEKVGPLADVYSLGAVLYQSVTGRAPFRAASVMETLEQVIHQEPVAPNQLNPAVDRDLNTVILKCLQKEPVNRYATAFDLAQDIERFLQHRPIKARRTSFTERTWRWVKRNRIIALLLFATATALLGTAAVSSFAAVTYRDQAAEESRLRRKMSEDLYVAEMSRADDAITQSHLHQTTSNILSHWYPGNPKYSNYVPDVADDFRGWEWYFLWGLTRGNRVYAPGIVRYADVSSENVFGFGFAKNFAITQFGQTSGGVTWNAHETETVCVCFSRNGKLFATAGLNGAVKIWEVHSRQLIATLPHELTVRAISFDDSASTLVTATEDAVIYVWDMKTNTVVREISEDVAHVPCVRVSPDGTHIATGCEVDGSFPIAIWDLTSGRRLAMLNDDAHSRPVESIDWSPDGQRILSGSSDRRVCVWDIDSGKRILNLTDHHLPVYAVAWSPDGKTIASGGDDMEVYLRDSETGQSSGVFGHEAGESSSIRSLAWSPDSRKLVGAIESGILNIIDLGTRRCLHEFRIKSADRDAETSGLQWQAGAAQLSATRGTRTVTWSLKDATATAQAETLTCWNQDATLTASIKENELIIKKGDLIQFRDQLPQTPRELLWSPTHDTLAVRLLSSICIWRADADNGTLSDFYSIPPKAEREAEAEVDSMTWSHDGKLLALGTSHGYVRIHHAENAEKDVAFRLGVRGYQQVRVRTIDWKPGSSMFAIGTSSNYIYFYDHKTLPRQANDKLDDRGIPAHDAHVRSVAWSPDGTRLASASADRTVKLWNVDADGLDGLKMQNVLTVPHDAEIRLTSWSDDGLRLATLTDNGLVSVFDATYGHEWAEWIDANPTQINWE